MMIKTRLSRLGSTAAKPLKKKCLKLAQNPFFCVFCSMDLLYLQAPLSQQVAKNILFRDERPNISSTRLPWLVI